MNHHVPREDIERFTAQLAEKRRRMAKQEHSRRGYRDENGVWQGGLLAFVRYFWHVLEPGTPFTEGWILEAIVEHLEAVTFGEITNLLVNVPPGCCKSLLTNVYWPAWEWSAMELSHIRYVTFSYSASNTERDNQRFGDLVTSSEFQLMYPEVKIRQNGMTMVSNYNHGWKLASSVTGSATGKRGNRAICDDLNNVKESESKPVMEETNRWLRESLSSRLNNMETDAKIVIAQRVGEGDASGEILSLGLPYCHLCIAMEYVWSADENGQPYATQIGWVDPRWRPTPEECNGELAWHERFSENAVRALKKELGPYATAAQLQQTPEARGGGIFKRDWWQVWDPPDGKFPPFSYIVASLDGAFTSKEENDPSALTVWGIFENEMGYNRAMLIHAWSKKLPFSGVKVDVLPGEHDSVYRRRAMPHWGLIEWVADTCNRFKADRLLIENKGPGISAAQSLSNSHGRSGWAIELVEPKGDHTARALAVQPTFSQLMVHAPDREWADDTIDEMAVFPKGRHDDRVDSATQAIKHLRDNGILRSDEERRAEEIEAVTHKGKQMQKRPRYPGMRATG
jgi:predicted phage terminase large subunit-like protein